MKYFNSVLLAFCFLKFMLFALLTHSSVAKHVAQMDEALPFSAISGSRNFFIKGENCVAGECMCKENS